MDEKGEPIICPACQGGSAIILHGKPEELIEGDPEDVFRTAQLCSQIAHGGFPRSVQEYDAHAATFIQAWDFLGPYLKDEIEAKIRRDQHGSNQPGSTASGSR